jgi:hypothetical protein
MRNAAMVALTFAVVAAQAQFPLQDKASASFEKGPSVVYLFPEQVTVPAGKASTVALHFRIGQGLHINSHTPKDAYLIPTTLAIPAASGVRLDGATYPAGVDFTLPVDPSTKLSVYTGEFVITAQIAAQRGNHLVQGTLHYQACDNNACMPPKTIPVAIDVIGK